MAPNTNKIKCTGNEDGFVLIGALLILVLLMIIGISATTNTSLELQIAGNDRTHKETFYQADGGTQLAARLVEEGLGTPGGFPASAFDANELLVDPDPAIGANKLLRIETKTLSENNDTSRNEDSVSDEVIAGKPMRDVAYFPDGYDSTDPNIMPHTNIIVDGATSVVAGSGLQMIAGYEGKGKGTAGGGGKIDYNIFSQHIGRANSESVVAVVWRHVIGLELEGRY